jgi:DNA topoisomerase-1
MEYLLTKYLIYKQLGGNKIKWTTLHHNGVLIQKKYIAHKVPLIYNGENIILNEESEEIATIYSKYIDTEYMNNKTFKKNFWKDFKKILKNPNINDFDLCDFSLIYEHYLRELERGKNISKEEKEALKKQKDTEEEKYKYAIVDGKQQMVGNFRVENSGIFIGKGCTPLLGKIKKRIYPEDITLNLSKDAVVPDPPEGHRWGKIVHDRKSIWLASWHDNVTGKIKYVWLSDKSDFKTNSDIEKFEKARKLKKKIKKIREINNANLESMDIKTSQISTALYFIDTLALRVGNEKGEDTADTYGVTTLLYEHIKLEENNKIKLDFLGKDSVRYINTFTVTENVYNNIKKFLENKKIGDELFDKINSNDINKYLQSFMKGLTAKIFRTYNASNTMQKELLLISKKFDDYSGNDKINTLLEFNKANLKVAVLCNHQKAVSKSFDSQLEKINIQINELKKKLKKATTTEKKNNIKNKIKKLKIKKHLKTELKNISLGTSRANYVDPRIIVSFMKKHNIPIEKVFSKSLIEKFSWALDTDENFMF